MTRRWILSSVCSPLVILSFLVPSLVPSQVSAGYAYFFSSDGRFVKIDGATFGVVDRGSLLDGQGVRGLFPEVLVETGIRVCCYSQSAGQLYIVTPVTAKVAADGTVPYKIAAFELPTFRLAGSVELAEPVYKGPNLLFDTRSDNLLVSYELKPQENIWVFAKETYDSRTLNREKYTQESVPQAPYDPEAVARARFTKNARLAPDGTIIDRAEGAAAEEEYAIVQGRFRRRTPPSWPKEIGQFLTFAKGKPHFRSMRLDEASQRILLWEVDGDGKRATGKLVYYDARAHTRIRRFFLREIEGEIAKVIAVSQPDEVAYIATGRGDLYGLRLATPEMPVRIDLFGLSALNVQAVFTDR